MENSCFLIFFFMCTGLFAANTATRTLPDTYTPGGSFDVTVNVNTDWLNMPTGVIVVESLPAGWSITSSTLTWNKYTASTNSYTWLQFSQTGVWPFSITYTVSVPSSARNTQTISGVLRISGVDAIAIGGDSTIEENAAFSKGDINRDKSVDVTDVILCLRMAVELDIVIDGVTYSPPSYNDTLKTLADMNVDQLVDVSDVILTLRKAVGLPI